VIWRAILIVMLALALPAAARACTCSPESPGQCPGLQPGDVVFLGTVTAVEDIADAAPKASDSSGPPVDIIAARLTRYHFQIDEHFAAPGSPQGAAEIDIFSGGDDGDCGYRFKLNEQYVVFTHEGTEGRLFSTICNGTRPVGEARALLPQLRAMRKGQRIASVFGSLRRADPPFLARPDDPDDPIGNVSLKLRSHDDRFETSTDANGLYSFYDVHEGEYSFTANLPPRTELTQKSLTGGLPPFKIPNGACYEYDVVALPTGHIRGSVIAENGKPLGLASVEIYRAGAYDESKPGLWAFQGAQGVFDFDHVGAGEYIIVFNRTNRMDPNSPYRRTFYPGVTDINDAEAIQVKDGQQLLKVKIQVKDAYPTRGLRVQLKWQGAKPAGSVTVMAKAETGENPAAQELGEGTYEFPLFPSGNYTVSAWEDLAPQRSGGHANADCTMPSRIDATSVAVSGSDDSVKEITLTFPITLCAPPAPTPENPDSATPPSPEGLNPTPPAQ
jgi:hypothetical protein